MSVTLGPIMTMRILSALGDLGDDIHIRTHPGDFNFQVTYKEITVLGSGILVTYRFRNCNNKPTADLSIALYQSIGLLLNLGKYIYSLWFFFALY